MNVKTIDFKAHKRVKVRCAHVRVASAAVGGRGSHVPSTDPLVHEKEAPFGSDLFHDWGLDTIQHFGSFWAFLVWYTYASRIPTDTPIFKWRLGKCQ